MVMTQPPNARISNRIALDPVVPGKTTPYRLVSRATIATLRLFLRGICAERHALCVERIHEQRLFDDCGTYEYNTGAR
jgi:hypothetical protein